MNEYPSTTERVLELIKRATFIEVGVHTPDDVMYVNVTKGSAKTLVGQGFVESKGFVFWNSEYRSLRLG